MDLDWPPRILVRGLHRCDINCAPRIQYQSLFREVRVPSQNVQGSPAAAKIEWRLDLVGVAFSFRRVSLALF